MQKTNITNNNDEFTLIELIIVIVIVIGMGMGIHLSRDIKTPSNAYKKTNRNVGLKTVNLF
ncbi:MAG: Tfp pilus assembly protein PilE [Paraglaciecola sp.]|jgi:Tfp pilus assembly protein PilE